MSHRLGHIDGTNSYASMDRRKYLGAMAAGAAFGAVAACGGGTSTNGDHDEHGHDLTESGRTLMKQFGYLSIFPPAILTFEEARKNMPVAGSKMIRLPFFNESNIELKEKMVVGFHVVRIGCPSIFAVAFNLITKGDEPEESEREGLIKRNTRMDEILRGMGYTEVEWAERDLNCPDPEPWAK